MIDLANKLNSLLKESEEAQEYFQLKKFLSNDVNVQNLLNQIQQKQKLLQESLKENNMQNYSLHKRELDELKEQFCSHPIINNYIQAKNDLENLLQQIIMILSDH